MISLLFHWVFLWGKVLNNSSETSDNTSETYDNKFKKWKVFFYALSLFFLTPFFFITTSKLILSYWILNSSSEP